MRLDDMTIGQSSTSPPRLRNATDAFPLDDDRGIEGWIASTLEGRSQPRTTRTPTTRPVAPAADSAWLALARRTLQQRTEPERESKPDPKSKPLEPWARFRLVEGKGCTILRLNDHALLKEDDIRELANELVDLIANGHPRLLLNFADVHRLSSRAFAMLLKVHRHCAEEGGRLKICGLRRELGEAVSITGLEREIGVHPDETSAVEAGWPLPVLRPLPIEELLALGARGSFALRAGRPASDGSSDARSDDQSEPDRIASRVRLVVATGKSRGWTIPVTGPRFAIGRDPHCQLRPESAKVSRMHTWIEQRDRRVFVRDLGSANGTSLNGRTLRGESAEAFNGDQIRVGPLELTLEVGGNLSKDARVAEIQVTKWLLESAAGVDPCAETILDVPNLTEPHLTPSSADVDLSEAEASDAGTLKFQVLQDVLVVAIRTPVLEDEDEIALIRAELLALFERPLPRRIVVDLDVVNRLSSGAVGMLVAHLLRVERAGGSIRLCQAQAGVRSVLERIGMPLMMESYLTIDEAVLASWR